MAKEIRKVAVIGGGTMGSGIGQLIAQKGVMVVVKETGDERAEACKSRILRQLDKISNKPNLREEVEAARRCFSTTGSYDDLRDADIVIEAVFENMGVKKSVFQELNPLFPKRVIFTTNSSSLSIDEIASVTDRPDRFIGSHFFNPAVQRPLVELVCGSETSNETFETVRHFVEVVLGRISILVKGCPGYLVNRLLLPYLNEAAHLLTETTLTVKEIDARARKFGWPMGPFELLDFVGNDIAVNVAGILYRGYGERAKPVPLMNRMVELGRIGKKAGAGFYVESKSSGHEDIKVVIDSEYPHRQEIDVDVGFNRMMAGLYNEAILCLEEGVAPADVIETGAVLGIMFPMALEGPLHYAQKYGLPNLLADLKRFEAQYGVRFKPAQLLEQLVAEGRTIFQADAEEEW